MSTTSDSDYEKMKAALTRWVDIPEPQWHEFAALFSVKNAAAQEYIILPGSKTYQLFFVCQGLLRIYYIDESGKESNKSFICENVLTGPMAASALDLPVLYGLQALEPTRLLVARHKDFAALCDRHPVFDRLGRKLAESLLIYKERRERSLLQHDAKQRYLDFLHEYAHLVDRLPQYQIASYLGITEVSLSRIRSNLRQSRLS